VFYNVLDYNFSNTSLLFGHWEGYFCWCKVLKGYRKTI